nr:CASP-like protein 1 [Tanacetum cinerariifolium]
MSPSPPLPYTRTITTSTHIICLVMMLAPLPLETEVKSWIFTPSLSVACLYSTISGVLSILTSMKTGGKTSNLQFYFVIFDVLLLGIMASATGAAGGVAYIGLKGNSHTGWTKVCNVYGFFCFHFAASIFLSLLSSIILLLLVWLSIYVLFKKITRQ